jgi:hypothetical protein
MSRVSATLPHLTVGMKDPVHRRDAPEILALVEQLGVCRRRGVVAQLLGVERVTQLESLFV